MEQQEQLSIVRRAYAKQTLAAARISDVAIENAFAAVPRENFLGSGPWPMYRRPPGTYVTSLDADPVYVYVDQVIGLIPERRINNGQPSLHAMLIAAGAEADASWQIVELRTNQDKIQSRLGFSLPFTCAYLDYVTMKVLPLFSIHDAKQIPRDICDETEVGLRAQVLMPTPQLAASR